VNRSRKIGRMHPLSPLQGEVYYLRCFLLMVPGPSSFEDLRTVNGVRHDTFENACYTRGIITRDNEWELCFDKACHFQTGWYLRRLLISAMVWPTPPPYGRSSEMPYAKVWRTPSAKKGYSAIRASTAPS
jgi:hypothetical protein